MTTPLTEAEFALHRYFLWANRMRLHYLSSGVPPLTQPGRRQWLIAVFPYAAIWLGYLHVLAEGWRDIGLRDDRVDKLLESPHLDLLRRFRNGTFHFQAKYYDPRFVDFLTGEAGGILWAGNLHDALDLWFRDRMRAAGAPFPEEP